MEDTDQVLTDNPNIYVHGWSFTQRNVWFVDFSIASTLELWTLDLKSETVYIWPALIRWKVGRRVSLSFSKNYACFVYLYAYVVQNLFNAS